MAVRAELQFSDDIIEASKLDYFSLLIERIAKQPNKEVDILLPEVNSNIFNGINKKNKSQIICQIKSPYKTGQNIKIGDTGFLIKDINAMRVQLLTHEDIALAGWPGDILEVSKALAGFECDDAAMNWFANIFEKQYGLGAYDNNDWIWLIKIEKHEI